MDFLLTLTATTGAAGVELLEALAVVLGVGVTRGFRPALWGALAASGSVVVLCAALGPALRAGAGLGAVRVLVGGALLLFGMEWLRKGVLRVSGRRRRGNSYHEFVDARDASAVLPGLAGGCDWAAVGVSFHGVLLEDIEVGLIVLALGSTPGHAAPALLGAGIALVLVIGAGVLLRQPLQRLPEIQIKLAMGAALTAFGTYFAAQGAGVHWPVADLAPIYLIALFAATAWLAVRQLRKPLQPPPAG
jgi:uncharacterized membrane protein